LNLGRVKALIGTTRKCDSTCGFGESTVREVISGHRVSGVEEPRDWSHKS
jgi:hypothetical protein